LLIVELLDSLDVVGHLNGWRSVSAVERDGHVGSWSFEAPTVDANRGLLADWASADRPGVAIRDADTSWRYTGLLESLRIDDVFGKGQVWTASGSDFNVLLADRLARPSAAEANWWQYATASATGDPVSVATQFIQLAGIYSLDVQREPPWPCDVFAGGSALPNTTVRPQGAECLRLIRELLEGTDYYLQRKFVPAQTPAAAELQWEILPRPVSATKFSARDGNIQKVSVTRTVATATEIIGVGADTTAPAREVRTASTHDSTWLGRYREQLENQPSMSGAELQDHVDRQAAVLGPKTTVTAVDPDATLWGNDLDVGWLAEVAVPTISGDYVFEQLPVVQVSLTGTGGEWERSVEFGSRDLRDVSKLVAEVASIRALAEATKRGVT